MHKVDSFKNVNDFIRTFGTLCWNLSKVIPFKDMPIIYTCHLPEYSSLDSFDNSLDELKQRVCSRIIFLLF